MPPLGAGIVVLCFGIVLCFAGRTRKEKDPQIYYDMVLPFSTGTVMVGLSGIVHSAVCLVLGLVIVFGDLVFLIVRELLGTQILRLIAQFYLAKNQIRWIDPECGCERDAVERIGSSCPVHGSELSPH